MIGRLIAPMVVLWAGLARADDALDAFARAWAERLDRQDVVRVEGAVAHAMLFLSESTTVREPQTMLVQRPDRLLLESERLRIVCDGRTLIFQNPQRHLFAQRGYRAPVRDIFQEEPIVAAWAVEHPEVDALLSTNALAALRHWLRERNARLFPEKDWQGQRCWVVEGQHDTAVSDAPIQFRIWIDQQSGLTRRVEHIEDASRGAAPEGERTDAAELLRRLGSVYEATSLSVPTNLAADTFAFAPGNDRQVQDIASLFGYRDGSLASSRFIMAGQHAPALDVRLLDGQEFRLADLTGRVAAVVFWSMHSDASIRRMSALATMAAQFPKEDLQVIGVCRDDPAQGALARHVVRRLGVGFPVGFGGIYQAQAFKVRSLPCVVLLDRTGHIRARHVGFERGSSQNLAADLECLVAGKPVSRRR